MSKLKQTDKEIIITCDCGVVNTLSKDENGKIKLTSVVKKKPESTEPPKKRNVFDDFFGIED